MNKTTAIRIIIVSGLVFPPIWLVDLFIFYRWIKNPSEKNEELLKKTLRFSVIFSFIIMWIICFLFYQYGRNFIHVMGTFY